MKIMFKYQDESPFLMPKYSRYYEVIEKGEKHVGMIHLAHVDWRAADGTMPPFVEMELTAKFAQNVKSTKITEGKERKGGRNTSTRVIERPPAPKSKSFNRKKGR